MLHNARLDRKRTATSYNVMVTGHAGAGKTSLIDMLVHSLSLEDDEVHGNFGAIEKVFVTDVLSDRTEEVLSLDVAGRHHVHLTLIDAPGVRVPEHQHQYVNHGSITKEHEVETWYTTVLSYIETQYNTFLMEETKVKRNTRQVDKRVHMLLYLLDPHQCTNGLPQSDRRILMNLSVFTNVVLVLGKGDILSFQERQRMLTKINADAQAAQLRLYDGLLEEDANLMMPEVSMESDASETSSEQDVRRALSKAQVSFVLFNGERSEKDNLIQFHREFLWGTANALNPKHSDFVVFKNAMLFDCVEDLMEITRMELYEEWRTTRLLKHTAKLHLEQQRRVAMINDE